MTSELEVSELTVECTLATKVEGRWRKKEPQDEVLLRETPVLTGRDRQEVTIHQPGGVMSGGKVSFDNFRV